MSAPGSRGSGWVRRSSGRGSGVCRGGDLPSEVPGGWRRVAAEGRIGCMPSVKSGTGSGGSDVGLLREYATHLRVEKGLRPLSVEADRRDLESFAEFVEGENRTLVTARQEDVSGF